MINEIYFACHSDQLDVYQSKFETKFSGEMIPRKRKDKCPTNTTFIAQGA